MDQESSASYSVFATKGAVHAARVTTDEAELRLMSMADGRTLSSVVAFKAEQQKSDLPPGHVWSRLVDIFGHSSHGGAPLQGSDVDLHPDLGSEAWSIVLPGDVEEKTRTIFFKTRSGPREVRLAGVADSPDVISAAVSHLLRREADKVDVRRNDPIIAIVYPQPCLAHDPTCPQSLVRLKAATDEPPVEAAFDRRGAPHRALEAALDLFVEESQDDSVELNADRPFEGRWPKTARSSLFRFSPSRPFRVVTEEGWAGCLSLEGLNWFEAGIEDVLSVWPETPEDLQTGVVEPCTKESPRHWTLTAGAQSVTDTAGGPPRRTILLHSSDAAGKLRLLAVSRRNSTTQQSLLTTRHPVDSTVATEVVKGLAKRLGPDDVILEMTDDMPAEPGSGIPMIVFEIADTPNLATAGASHRTRLLAFYWPGDLATTTRVCTLSGIEIVRPGTTTEAEFFTTHQRIVETLHDWLSERQEEVCETVRPREYLLIDTEAGEWQVWERMNGSTSAEASGPAELRRSAAPRPRVIGVAQAITLGTDAVNPASSNDMASNYVEVRQLGEQALRVWIDALLYARTSEIAGTLEREIIRAIVHVSKQIHPSRPTVPNFRLNCVDDRCLLVEGAWGLQEVLGLDLGTRNEPSSTRAVLLRGPTWREAGIGLASRLVKSMREERAQIFDLRSSPALDVHLAVRDREPEVRTRPVFRWDPLAAAWQELGDLVPLPTAENAEAKHLELPVEQAILNRLTAAPKPFRLISLPNGSTTGHRRDAILLTFENHLLDGLPRTESFFRDGSTGPDILTDKPLLPAIDLELLGRAQAVLSSDSLRREHLVWLPGEEASGLAISGSISGFESGHVELVSVQGIEPKANTISSRLDFGKNCRLPRDVARNLLPGHRHFGAKATITCTLADGSALLSDHANLAHQLVGDADFRAKLMGKKLLAKTAAIKLAIAAQSATGHPYPELSTGKSPKYHYAAFATPEGGRVWRERDGNVRELGVFSNIDLSDLYHHALLHKLESVPANRPFTGTVQEHNKFLALIIDGLNEVIVHRRNGATIRVKLIGDTILGGKPVDQSIGKLLDERVPRSLLASSGGAAVAFTRTETDLLGNAFAYFDGAIDWFETWPADLESHRAKGVAQFLLELLQGDRSFHRVYRRAELLVACRSSASNPRRSEFVLFDLEEGIRAGRLEWADDPCEDAKETVDSLLDPIHALAENGLVRQPGGRLLGYRTRGGTIGALYGEDSTLAKRLFTIDTSGVVFERCEASLGWDHPARDALTDWLAGDGPCRWLRQSDSRIIADAQERAMLLGPAKSWDLEPLLDSDRSSLENHAGQLLDWADNETMLHAADCSVIRFGNVEVSLGSPPIFSASVPCYGLALLRGAALNTTFRRTARADQKRLSRDGIGWLARRFDEAIPEGDSYNLDVGDVLELTPRSSAMQKALLFVWNSSNLAECSAVLPIRGQTGGRIAAVRDLLRDRGPDSNWQGESYVRVTWSESVGLEMAVLSRSESGDCVKDFLDPPEQTSLNASRYKHFALAGSRPDAEWTEVELGKEPALVLTLLDDGTSAAFFSIFQQIGGNVHGRSISIRPTSDIRFAIHRDETLYHRLFPNSPACKTLPSKDVEELLAKRSQGNEEFSLPRAWDKLFEAVAEQEFKPRWYEPVLLGDPLHELDQVSGPC